MADVIRDAVIRIRTEQTKSKLEAPEVAQAVRANQEVAASAKESAKAQQESSKATQESSESLRKHAEVAHVESAKASQAVGRSSLRMVRSFNEAGEGAFRFGRGLALLSASGSEDMRKLAQSVALAQGAFDVFAGGAKVLTNLSTAFGPVGIAVGATTLALGAGYLAWKKWQSGAEEATKAAIEKLEEAHKKQVEFTKATIRDQQQRTDRQRGDVDFDLDFGRGRTALATSDAERRARLQQEEQRIRAGEQHRAFERKQAESRFRGGITGLSDEELLKEQAANRPGAVLGVARQAEKEADLRERLLQIEQERYEIAQRELEERRRQALSGSKLFGGFGQDAINRSFDQQGVQLAKQVQGVFDPLFEALEQERRRAKQFRDAVNQAHPN